MLSGFFLDNNHFQVIRNDDVSFDTDRPSVELFPANTQIVKSGFQIEFPGFFQAYAYYRAAPSGFSECELWTTVFWQEWGPDEAFHNEEYFPGAPQNSTPGPTTRNLPRILLGYVPAETNFLDVRVKLTRTTTPPAWYSGVPRVMFKEGEWINLPGGSCPTETVSATARHFDIVMKEVPDIGSVPQPKPVYLERYQSVQNFDTLNAPGNNAQAAITSNQSGWNSRNYYANTSAGGNLAVKTNWQLATLLQRKADQDGNKRPNGTNPCTGTFKDLKSVFTGDIIIIPGRQRA